jgi:hypothetical protein
VRRRAQAQLGCRCRLAILLAIRIGSSHRHRSAAAAAAAHPAQGRHRALPQAEQRRGNQLEDIGRERGARVDRSTQQGTERHARGPRARAALAGAEDD